MNRLAATSFTALLVLLQNPAFAATKAFPIRERRVIIDDGSSRIEPRANQAVFSAELLGDDGSELPESFRRGRPFVAAAAGERYAIRLRNPLPVRVAVNLTMDGLNSISGKPSGIADGQKWMIEPYDTIVIRGWQVNGDEARRFFFTDKPKSYAKWREGRLGRDLSANCGVIGAAFFWSQAELDRYYEEHPEYRYTTRYPWPGRALAEDAAAMGGAAAPAPAAKAELKRQQAGTGMGERESHPTTEVAFDFDTGMYRLDQALVIYYDFAPRPPAPNPFPDLTYAPEIPGPAY